MILQGKDAIRALKKSKSTAYQVHVFVGCICICLRTQIRILRVEIEQGSTRVDVQALGLKGPGSWILPVLLQYDPVRHGK